MITMLIDHIGFVFDLLLLRIIGRVAFPVFAFQISEGFIHTRNKKKYALKLFLFAFISEIPFNLFISGEIIYPEKQNVLFTLLIGMLIIWCIDSFLLKHTPTRTMLYVFLILILIIITVLLKPDYDMLGILTVIMFYAYTRCKIPLPILSVAYAVISILHAGYFQFFAVLSMIFIGLYNGKKGGGKFLLQQIGYWFYPIHMLILSVISFILLQK